MLLPFTLNCQLKHALVWLEGMKNWQAGGLGKCHPLSHCLSVHFVVQPAQPFEIEVAAVVMKIH